MGARLLSRVELMLWVWGVTGMKFKDVNECRNSMMIEFFQLIGN